MTSGVCEDADLTAMLKAVLFAQLRFHDTTSRGRLLNRFGKDIEGLDSSMADNCGSNRFHGNTLTISPSKLSLWLECCRYLCLDHLCGRIAVCCSWRVSLSYVGAIRTKRSLMLVLYYQAGSIYGQTSRDMRRLDSVTRSPLYSLFGETVSGVAVIRAFGASTIALKQMMRLSDTNLLAFYWSW